MKKNYFMFLILFLVYIFLLVIINIFFKDFTFSLGYTNTYNNLSFESNIKLKRVKNKDYDLYYYNKVEKVYVYLNIDNKEKLGEFESLKKYAKAMSHENGAIVKRSENGNYYYFTYKNNDEFYMVSFYEDDESYYKFTFKVDALDYREYDDRFISWADSVNIK